MYVHQILVKVTTSKPFPLDSQEKKNKSKSITKGWITLQKNSIWCKANCFNPCITLFEKWIISIMEFIGGHIVKCLSFFQNYCYSTKSSNKWKVPVLQHNCKKLGISFLPFLLNKQCWPPSKLWKVFLVIICWNTVMIIIDL